MEEITQTPESWLDMGAWIGRLQAFGIVANKCSAAQALSLKRIKESADYKKLGLTWDGLCERYLAISSRQADRLIEQYDEFGEAYFRLSNLACISPENYRQFSPSVTGNCIEIDGEKVAIVPENGDRIRAFIRAQKRAQLAPTPTVAQVGLRLRHAAMDARHCAESRLSRKDLQLLQQHVGYAIQEWIELGHRLDRLEGD
jgi:hypothetical protein